MKEKVITDRGGVCHWICPQIKVIISLNIPFYLLTYFWKTSYVFSLAALPLRGSIPDMTADSKRYIELQNM